MFKTSRLVGWGWITVWKLHFLRLTDFLLLLQYDRLKKLHAELEEKLEASEIQIKGQSTEYRTLLQQKDVRAVLLFHDQSSSVDAHVTQIPTRCLFLFTQVEISHLKARQSGLQEEVQRLQRSAQSAAVGPAVLPVSTTSSTTTSSSSFLSRTSGSHQGFHGDEMDLSDVLWSQHEINRLSTEVTRLEAELAHWRRMSQVTSGSTSGSS